MPEIWTRLRHGLKERAQQFAARLGAGGDRLAAHDEAHFLRQFSLMVESGITFHEALRVLEGTGQGKPAELARGINDCLYRGYSLSGAFSSFRHRISEVCPALVEAGEKSGGLTRTLHIAADWAELSADLRAKMKSAMIYPAFVLGVNLVLAGAMLGYVFPTFLPLFQGEELPLLTRFFLGLSWLATSKLFWLVALLLTVEGFAFFAQPEHREKLHRVAVLVPVLGPMLRSAARCRFCSVLAVTTRTGLPLMKAMTLAAKASGDPHFLDLDEALQREVREGNEPHEHFLTHREVYGVILSHGMALCQATGRTDKVCAHLASLYAAETETRVRDFQSLLEPLLIAMVSMTTGLLLLSIYWPLGKFLETLVN